MNEQTEKYIVLKPIADKFKEVAEGITTADIRKIIEGEIKLQLQKIDFTASIKDVAEDFFYKNEEEVISLVRKALIKRLDI